VPLPYPTALYQFHLHRRYVIAPLQALQLRRAAE
jgi:hypothetical protein